MLGGEYRQYKMLYVGGARSAGAVCRHLPWILLDRVSLCVVDDKTHVISLMDVLEMGSGTYQKREIGADWHND